LAVILTASKLENLATVKKEIQDDYSNLQVFNSEDLAQNANQILSQQRLMFAMIKNSVILAVIMMVMIVVVVAGMEQRKDIGTLRAVGAGRWSIFGMVAGQSLVLSLFGAILALPIAVFLTRWGLTEISGLSGILSVWLQTILVAMIVGLLASILPAWQALRVDPLEELRYE
jgi:putative ABC transport system permease protein